MSENNIENEWIYRSELEKLNKSLCDIKRYFEKCAGENIIIKSKIYDIETCMANTDNIAKSSHVVSSDNAYSIRRIERLIEESSGKKIDKLNKI